MIHKLSFIISAKCLLVNSKSLNLSFNLLNKTSIVIVLFFLISSNANLTCSFYTIFIFISFNVQYPSH